MSQKIPPGIKKLGPKRWAVRWTDHVATRQVGKRVELYEVVEGNLTDAQRFLRKKKDANDKGRSTKPSKLTVWEYLDAWLTERKAADKIRPQTISDYRDTLERYVQRSTSSTFGAMKLSRVTEADVAAFYETLPSPAMKRRVHVLVRAAFARAVKRGLLPFNPTDDAELPDKEPTKRTPLAEDQVSRLLAAAWDEADGHRRNAHDNRSRAAILRATAKGFRANGDSDRAQKQDDKAAERERAATNDDRLHAIANMYFTLWTLLFDAGMRPGEALALQWTDLHDGVLSVEHSKDKSGNIGLTKNKKRRDVRLHGPALDALEAHRQNQRSQIEVRRAAGKSYTDNGYIFANQEGGLLDWTNVRNQRWNPLVERSGIEAEREKAAQEPAVPYIARHTVATRLRDRGVPIDGIAGQLGHKPQMSLDHYQPATPALLEQVFQAGEGLATFTPKQPVLPS